MMNSAQARRSGVEMVRSRIVRRRAEVVQRLCGDE